MEVKYKACDEVTFQEDIELVSMLGDEKTILKSGSKGIVTLRGNIVISSGELRGKILPQSMFEFEADGVNTNNLAKMILTKMKRNLPDFEGYMGDWDLEDSNITDEIWEVLSDYL